MGTSGVLARGWWRARRRWWVATIVLLVVVQTVVLSVAAVFHGMESETNERISAFFTDDVRVTRGPSGAASNHYWSGEELDAALDATGGMPRLESQFVLSRRGLVEAYLQEQEQYEVRAPGASPGGTDFYGIGVLVGLPLAESGAERVRPYMLSGRMPVHDNETVELLMSARSLADYLKPEERARMNWPPSAAELQSLRFEITTARINPQSDIKDLIRYPARVVGVYDTRLDVIDTFTLVADQSDVQRLLGFDPGVPVANAITLRNPEQEALQAAAAAGWRTEGAEAFAQRYLGQLVDVLRGLSLGLSALFLVLPLFLVWHGMGQMLQMHHREYAVCRAIGVPAKALGQAMGRLATLVVLAGTALTALVVLALQWGLDAPLATNRNLPMPVAYLPQWSLALMLLATVGAVVALSVLAAMRRHLAEDLSTALRAS